ncbi:MAG: hypothetical protein IIV41_03085 [Akkermansia sp.]|nr:hypothetical protein [Akkermansia sp.]
MAGSLGFVSKLDLRGVTRRTLSNWRKMKGAPEPNPNGSHNVSAWRDFVQANELKGCVDGGGAETEALKARKLLAEVEERELKVAVKEGEYILLEDVRKGWHALVGKAIVLLRAFNIVILAPKESRIDFRKPRCNVAIKVEMRM